MLWRVQMYVATLAPDFSVLFRLAMLPSIVQHLR